MGCGVNFGLCLRFAPMQRAWGLWQRPIIDLRVRKVFFFQWTMDEHGTVRLFWTFLLQEYIVHYSFWLCSSHTTLHTTPHHLMHTALLKI